MCIEWLITHELIFKFAACITVPLTTATETTLVYQSLLQPWRQHWYIKATAMETTLVYQRLLQPWRQHWSIKATAMETTLVYQSLPIEKNPDLQYCVHTLTQLC